MTDGYIYLAWAKGTDKYKIGSSAYPERRLKELQTGSPISLSLIAVKEILNPEMEERKLHKQWAEYRTQGEWFTFHPLQMPEVFAGFDIQDRWTAKRIEDLDNKAAQVLEGYAVKTFEEISKFSQKCLEAAKDRRKEGFSLIESKAYSSALFRLYLLSQYLDKTKALEINDKINSFDHELEILALSIDQEI